MKLISKIALISSLLIASLFNIAHAKSVSAEEFLLIPAAERFLLDVRTPKEFKDGHIPTATNIPVGELSQMYSQLTDKDQKIVVYCRSGMRAGRAISFLEEQGFTNLVHLEGDFGEWEKEQRAIVKP